MQVRTLDWLLDWPDHPAPDWHKGFLAGIFDAARQLQDGILRMAPARSGDHRLAGVLAGIARLRLRRGRATGPTGSPASGCAAGSARRCGSSTPSTPPITAKRSIDGAAIKSGAGLRVAAIEPLGLHVPMYDITTGTGDFIANGVVSHNCFARNSHTYLDLDAGADFNTRVVVKVNAPELVRKKLASPRWPGEHIAVGMNVDCYQRAEGRYQLMPGIIGALTDAANPFSILTKGTLILRDIELLAEAAEVTEVGLNVSAGSPTRTCGDPSSRAPRRRRGGSRRAPR